MLKVIVLGLLLVGSALGQSCGTYEMRPGACLAGDTIEMSMVVNATTNTTQSLILISPSDDASGDGEYDVYMSWNCLPTDEYFDYSLLGPYNDQLFSQMIGPVAPLGVNTLHVLAVRRADGTDGECQGDLIVFNTAYLGEGTCEQELNITTSSPDPTCSVLPPDSVQITPAGDCGSVDTGAWLVNDATCVENGTISLNFTAAPRTHPYATDYTPRLTLLVDEQNGDGAWDVYGVDRDAISAPFDHTDPATYSFKVEGPFGNTSTVIGESVVVQPFPMFYSSTLRGTVHLVRRAPLFDLHTACEGQATLRISGGLCTEEFPDDPDVYCFPTVPASVSTVCTTTEAPFNKIPGGPALEGAVDQLDSAIQEVFALVANDTVFNPFFEEEFQACQNTVFDFFCAMTFQSCPNDEVPCQSWCNAIETVCPVNFALNPQLFACDALPTTECRGMEICRSPSTYGAECLPCDCGPNGICDSGLTGSGVCTCNSGWEGADCRTEQEGFRLEVTNYVPVYIVSGLVGVSLGAVGATVVIRKSRDKNERELKDLIVNSGTFTAGDIAGLKPSQIKEKLAKAKNELQRQKLVALASGEKPPALSKDERAELAALPAAGGAVPVAEPGMYESSQWGK